MGPYALPYKLTTYEIVFYLNLILQGANQKENTFGCSQTRNLELRLRVDCRESCAAKLHLVLLRGGAVGHEAVDPEIRQVIARLFLDSPRGVAQSDQPFFKFGEEATGLMQSASRQVHILMAACHGWARGGLHEPQEKAILAATHAVPDLDVERPPQPLLTLHHCHSSWPRQSIQEVLAYDIVQ
jgi:hypothetical protein